MQPLGRRISKPISKSLTQSSKRDWHSCTWVRISSITRSRGQMRLSWSLKMRRTRCFTARSKRSLRGSGINKYTRLHSSESDSPMTMLCRGLSPHLRKFRWFTILSRRTWRTLIVNSTSMRHLRRRLSRILLRQLRQLVWCQVVCFTSRGRILIRHWIQMDHSLTCLSSKTKSLHFDLCS